MGGKRESQEFKETFRKSRESKGKNRFGTPPDSTRRTRMGDPGWWTTVWRIACRTGVIFCVFQGNRGESEVRAKR